MAVDYGTYSRSRAQALAQLNDARKRKAEADADARIAKAQAESRKSSDFENLMNLGIQAGAAYATGGASLAFAPQINQLTMGDKQGWSRDLSNIGSIAYGISEGNKAKALADADRAFNQGQASDERTYQMLVNTGAYDLASEKAFDMNNKASQYEKDRKKFKDQGFLSHLISPEGLERSPVPDNIEYRPVPASMEKPTTDQLNVKTSQGGNNQGYTSQVQNNDAEIDAQIKENARREAERVANNMINPALTPYSQEIANKWLK